MTEQKRAIAHLEYDFFKYILIIIAAFLIWWGIFAAIDRPSASERIDIFLAVQTERLSLSAQDELVQCAEQAVADAGNGQRVYISYLSALEQLSTSMLTCDIVVFEEGYSANVLPALAGLDTLGLSAESVLGSPPRAVEIAPKGVLSKDGTLYYIGAVGSNTYGGGKNLDDGLAGAVLQALLQYFN